MPSFTLSDKFIEYLITSQSKDYLMGQLLFPLIHQANGFSVNFDDNKIMYNYFHTIKDYTFYTWLSIMSSTPHKINDVVIQKRIDFEKLDYDVYIETAANALEKTLVVDCLNKLEQYKTITDKECLEVLDCKSYQDILNTSFNKEQFVMKEKVFVIYGRNEKIRRSMFDFLRAANLKPLEWEQVVTEVAEGTPYIGDVIDKGLEIAQAVLILFTGDDLAKLDSKFLKKDEIPEDYTFQPRPNVLFEAGLALGKYPKRTIIVTFGNLREISDLGGRHVIKFKNTAAKRKDILTRLQTAGCAVNMTGSDWLDVGSFK
jgi:predicted nucleotide-binding protein